MIRSALQSTSPDSPQSTLLHVRPSWSSCLCSLYTIRKTSLKIRSIGIIYTYHHLLACNDIERTRGTHHCLNLIMKSLWNHRLHRNPSRSFVLHRTAMTTICPQLILLNPSAASPTNPPSHPWLKRHTNTIRPQREWSSKWTHCWRSLQPGQRSDRSRWTHCWRSLQPGQKSVRSRWRQNRWKSWSSGWTIGCASCCRHHVSWI